MSEASRRSFRRDNSPLGLYGTYEGVGDTLSGNDLEAQVANRGRDVDIICIRESNEGCGPPPPPPPSGAEWQGHPWTVAESGASCTDACSAAGHSCTDGDWGVGSEAALRSALQAAGRNPSSYCSEGFNTYTGGDTPFFCGGCSGAFTHKCVYRSGESSYSCGEGHSSSTSRICRCV